MTCRQGCTPAGQHTRCCKQPFGCRLKGIGCNPLRWFGTKYACSCMLVQQTDWLQIEPMQAHDTDMCLLSGCACVTHCTHAFGAGAPAAAAVPGDRSAAPHAAAQHSRCLQHGSGSGSSSSKVRCRPRAGPASRICAGVEASCCQVPGWSVEELAGYSRQPGSVGDPLGSWPASRTGESC